MTPQPQRPVVTAEQRGMLRRILLVFAIVVVLVPLTGLGGWWTLVLVPLLGASAYGLVTAIRLRRSVRTHMESGDPSQD